MGKLRLCLLAFIIFIFFSCNSVEKSNYRQAVSAIDSSNYNRALKFLSVAIAEKESDTTVAYLFFMRAQMYEKVGNLDSALLDYTQSIKSNPTDISSYLHSGRIFNLLGKYEEALDNYNKALGISNNDIEVLLKRADILTATGHDSLAFEDYEKVISIEPENDYAIMSRGIIYERFKEHEKCCADLEKAAGLGNETASEFLFSMCGKQR